MRKTSAKNGDQPRSRPRLGVVVPMANEEKTVDEFCTRVLAQLNSNDSVFAVVDNASHDSTHSKLESWHSRDSRVNPVWAPENRSVVDAYFRGYREALSRNCDWILEMDGGLSHVPEEIPRFLNEMERGADFVAGCRFMKSGSHRGSVSRRFLSKGGTLLARTFLGSKMNDMTSGFECFSRAALEFVVKKGVRSRGHFFQTEIRHMLQDCNWAQVPITYVNPSKSVSNSSIVEALRNFGTLCLQERTSKTKFQLANHKLKTTV